jgi:hypothetical protein
MTGANRTSLAVVTCQARYHHVGHAQVLATGLQATDIVSGSTCVWALLCARSSIGYLTQTETL